jgi:hypothetical protein
LSSRSVGSNSFQVNGVPMEQRGRGPPFIAPKRNLPVRVSEIQTCSARRPDMSGNHYWNPILAPEMSGAGT